MQLTAAQGLWLHELRECAFWKLGYGGEVPEDVLAGMVFSQQPLAVLGEDDLPGLDSLLAAVGFPDRPSDADGGYHFEGNGLHPAGRYPQRTTVGLARLRADLDVALVRYVEAGPQFDRVRRHAVTWALVEIRGGMPSVVSTFSGGAPLCTGRPRNDPPDALWIALATHDGSRLDPIARRHLDGSWDMPWPDRDISSGRLDSAGVVQYWSWPDESFDPTESWSTPFDLMDGELRLNAPLQWYRYSRFGRHPGTVSHAMLAERYCGVGWSLRMDPESSWYWDDDPGVALSQPQPTPLAEEELPNLGAIRAELGLLSRPPRDQGGYTMGGSRYPIRVVLGLFRLEDGAVIGVIEERNYEGGGVVVFEIADDSARIVTSYHRGGC